jgi:sulfonate transport system permease protein
VTTSVKPDAVTTAASPVSKVSLKQRKWGLIRLASPVVLMALWQLGSPIGLIPAEELPSPSLKH